MAALTIVSNQPGAGKTCLAGALARSYARTGRKAAYYKPFSTSPDDDPDLAFLKAALETWGSAQGTVPSPTILPTDGQQPSSGIPPSETAAAKLSVETLEADYDLVLVEWESSVFPNAQPSLLMYGLEASQDLYTIPFDIDQLARQLGKDLKGVIINNVPRHRRLEAERNLVPSLKEQGIPVLGALPEDREMLALTVGQVADFLGGRWVEEPWDANLWIDRFLIGGNIMDSGPNYFGRYPNQAVITRSGRPDIQMASLMCETKFLVLTGGGEPTEYIRVEAQKHQASLLLVDSDTLETVESLDGLLHLSNPYSEHKLSRFTELIQENLDLANLGLVTYT